MLSFISKTRRGIEKIMKNILELDKQRYSAGGIPRFLQFYRKAQMSRNPIFHKIYKKLFEILAKKNGIEFSVDTKIGYGFYVGHPYGITINPKVVIGNNVNIHKGVTIGQENRGKRKGTPHIGDKVWIGVNSTIVGNIVIGDDVLIAPNTYINCDVPDHSVVLGNPCIIKHVDNATKDYINHIAQI